MGKPGKRPDEEEAALESSLSRVTSFVEVLEVRCELARERAANAKGTRAAARAQRQVEEAWADLEAARRLNHTVAAAVASAQAQVSVIEAEAFAVVGAAFKEFRRDRTWRRRATRPSGAPGRSRRAASTPRSPEELGEMVAVAMEAIVYVIADRNRLTAWLVDTRLAAAELREQVAKTSGDEGPEGSASIRRRLQECEGRAAYLERQLQASAAATQELLAGLRKLYVKVPGPAARAIARLKQRKPFAGDSN
jgi:hypothetical protein